MLRDARAVLFTTEQDRLPRQSFWLYRANERVVGYGTSEPPDDAQLQRELFLSRFPQLRCQRILLFLSRIHPKMMGSTASAFSGRGFLRSPPAARDCGARSGGLASSAVISSGAPSEPPTCSAWPPTRTTSASCLPKLWPAACRWPELSR